MKRKWIAGFIIGFLWMPINNSDGAENIGWENWPRITVQGKMSPKWGVFLDEEFRIGNDMNDRYFLRTDFGLTYRCTSWLDLGINYWHHYTQKKGLWTEERKPHFNLVLKRKIRNFDFQMRNRMEHRVIKGKDNVWRYRNRLLVTLPYNYTSFKIQPYCADEVFFSFDINEVSRNRVYIGLKGKLTKNIRLDCYYMAQFDKKGDDWTMIHVFGPKITFAF